MKEYYEYEYERNGNFQFWLKCTYCFLFNLILTRGPIIIVKNWRVIFKVYVLLEFLQKNMDDPYYEPTIMVVGHDKIMKLNVAVISVEFTRSVAKHC